MTAQKSNPGLLWLVVAIVVVPILAIVLIIVAAGVAGFVTYRQTQREAAEIERRESAIEQMQEAAREEPAAPTY